MSGPSAKAPYYAQVYQVCRIMSVTAEVNVGNGEKPVAIRAQNSFCVEQKNKLSGEGSDSFDFESSIL